eukprot:scaffold8921_cov137-Isochrysis_galbana.AAC.10
MAGEKGSCGLDASRANFARGGGGTPSLGVRVEPVGDQRGRHHRRQLPQAVLDHPVERCGQRRRAGTADAGGTEEGLHGQHAGGRAECSRRAHPRAVRQAVARPVRRRTPPAAVEAEAADEGITRGTSRPPAPPTYSSPTPRAAK